MEDKKVIVDSAKLKELQIAMINFKKTIDDANLAIGNAINKVEQTWKDQQFLDFKTTYKKYQSGITQFENTLETVSKETLPPLIIAAEEAEKKKLIG
jgi:uncharacterized protein YukE